MVAFGSLCFRGGVLPDARSAGGPEGAAHGRHGNGQLHDAEDSAPRPQPGAAPAVSGPSTRVRPLCIRRRGPLSR